MRLRLLRNTIVLFLLLVTSATAASAQRVLGPGDDALVLPRGVFRFRTLAQWTEFTERYGMNTPGRPNGSLEPLGVDFNLDTVGVRVFPNLTGLETGLRSLTGLPTFGVSLGNTLVQLRDRVSAFPLVFELGLSKRLSIGLNVPFVTTHSNVFFNVNTAGTNGNVAFNPALAVQNAFNADTTLVNQFGRAADQLSASLAACSGSSSTSCTSLNANRTAAQGLVSASTAFAGGISQIYTKSPFIPVQGTDAELAIEARIAAFKAAYQSFGVSSITSSAPFPAQARLTVTDAQKILTDPAYGIVADPLQSIHHSHFGDLDFGGKLLLIDTFGGDTDKRMSPSGTNFRFALGGIVRFPTGQIERPDNLVDVGTGRGAFAVEGRAFTDILLGSHFWQSAVVRLNHPMADQQTMRIINQPNLEIAPLYRKQSVHRALGSTLELETSPRWVVNDLLSISGQYIYRHKAQDHYTGTFNIPAAVTGYSDITIDASTLDLETEATEQRFGGGVAFSNLYMYEQGKAKIPFEVTFVHMQTMRGSGGNQPKFFIDQVQIRLYTRIFGADTRQRKSAIQ